MTREKKELKKAIELLTRAKATLWEFADQAGDVPEWNEGGRYYELSSAIRNFLSKNTD